jgi:hypothetical protein
LSRSVRLNELFAAITRRPSARRGTWPVGSALVFTVTTSTSAPTTRISPFAFSMRTVRGASGLLKAMDVEFGSESAAVSRPANGATAMAPSRRMEGMAFMKK